MNIKNMFLLVIALFCETCLAPTKSGNQPTQVNKRKVYNQPTIAKTAETTFELQTIHNVTETNYILPNHANEAIEAIIDLINQSDKIIFIVFSLNINKIIQKLINKLNEDANFTAELFINNTTLSPFWETFQYLDKFKGNVFKNFTINILSYSTKISQVHCKKIIFYKNRSILKIMDGSANFTNNGFFRSIDSTSLKTYSSEGVKKIEEQVQNMIYFFSQAKLYEKKNIQEVGEILTKQKENKKIEKPKKKHRKEEREQEFKKQIIKIT